MIKDIEKLFSRVDDFFSTFEKTISVSNFINKLNLSKDEWELCKFYIMNHSDYLLTRGRTGGVKKINLKSKLLIEQYKLEILEKINQKIKEKK